MTASLPSGVLSQHGQDRRTGICGITASQSAQMPRRCDTAFKEFAMKDNVVDFSRRTPELPPVPVKPPISAAEQEMFVRERKLFAEIRAIPLKPR